MTVKRSGLGRNLSVLLGHNGAISATPAIQLDIFKCPIQSLQPGKYQPRGEIEEAPLNDLAESIKKQGVLQPLLVRELSENSYEIIAGERRWRASQIAGLVEVPVIIKQVDDEAAMAIALIENLQREDLNAMDQARAMYRLTSEFSLTHQQVADLLSKSRTAVSNFLRLLALVTPVKKMLENGDLDMGHARTLLQLDDEQQYQVAQIIVAKNLSVRETEKLVERIKSGAPIKNDVKSDISEHVKERINSLAKQMKTKMNVKPKANGKGTLVIHYANETILEQLISQLSSRL